MQIIYNAQLARAVEYTNCFSAIEYPPNKCPGYDIKQSDGVAPVMLEVWGMRIIPSLPSFLGSLWPRVVAPDSTYGSNRTIWHLNWVQTNNLC